MKRALRRLAIASIVVGPFVYMMAGVIVVWRQHAPLTRASFANILLNENTLAFVLFTAAPLIELSALSWLLSWRFERRSIAEQRARFVGSVVAFVAVLAFSLWCSEEGLAAPILHLPGASTSAFAFVFLPSYGAAVLAIAFLAVWILVHAISGALLLLGR